MTDNVADDPQQVIAALQRRLDESIAQQTATADVLKVISRSTFDLQTVLETLIRSAVELSGANRGSIFLREGDVFPLKAASSTTPEFLQYWAAHPPRAGRGSATSRVIGSGKVEVIPDVLEDPDMEMPADSLNRIRAALGVPMLRDNQVEGVLVLTRPEPGPFTKSQIDLVQTFADQAMIAIENARLFDEVQAKTADLTESLQHQTATSEVLQVISRSVFDLQTVLDTLVDAAYKLCDARVGLLYLRGDDAFECKAIAGEGVAEASRLFKGRPIRAGRGTAAERVILTGEVQSVADFFADPDFDPKTRDVIRNAEAAGSSFGKLRSTLAVPMMRDATVIGVVAIARSQTGPFPPRQIELLRTFADQAVIAIENARLFDEVQTKTADLQESLQHQTATSEVLEVISRSPGELDPVFQTILASATNICDAQFGLLLLYEGVGFRCASMFNLPPAFAETFSRNPVIHPPPIDPLGRLIATRQLVHVVDVKQEPAYLTGFPPIVELVELGGARTLLLVPMLREEGLVGVIAIFRQTVHAFSDKQIELVTSFGSQAVIAIENARLLNETNEALERQTATADILKVIASSPADVQPVFDAIATSSNRLIGGFSTAVLRFVDDALHLVAFTPANPAADEALKSSFPRPLEEFPPFMLVRDGATQQIIDTESEGVSPLLRDLARLRGYRSMLFTPLMNQGKPIGLISVTRKEPGTFAQHHIELVRTFADQAVIAIENARLFNETKEALERQTATSEILRVISQSPTDVKPVFEAIAQTAVRLLGCDRAFIQRCDGKSFWSVAWCGPEGQLPMLNRSPVPIDPAANFPSRAIAEKKTLYLPDWSAIDLPEFERAIHDRLGINSALYLPLLRNGECIGLLAMAGKRANAFASKDIVLAESFRDQALIAIENTRLFNETREALERQTATSDVLNVIASSPTDTQPVFDAIARSAAELCEGSNSAVFRLRDGLVHLAGHYNPSPEQLAFAPKAFPAPLHRGYMAGRAIVDRAVAHVPDIAADPEYTAESLVKAGFRSAVSVPMFRNGEPIGAINVTREEARPFSDRQIDLLRTFADQAVIAIENARLFNETKEALERQTATSEILRVISQSPADVQPVFDAIVQTAVRLIRCDIAFVLRSDGATFSPAAAAGPGGPLPDLGPSHLPVDPDANFPSRAIVGKKNVHLPDWSLIDLPEHERQMQALIGVNSALFLPLLREAECIGVLALAGKQANIFGESEIALAESFRDQALIAIENVRLFKDVQAKTADLQESLQQQTATADVLKVISRSAFDLKSVLTTLTESAQSLCGASLGIICLRDGEVMRLQAESGCTQAFIDFMQANPIRPGRETITGRVFTDGKPVHVADVQADPEYNFGNAPTIGAYRAVLAVPLMRDGAVEGVLLLGRPTPGPFSQRQIDLVQTFADQAVIAIENVRLFDQVQARTRELSRSLDELRTAQDRLVQTEKLASLGQLTAGIAHEIKNPLNFVNNFSALSGELLDELSDLLKPADLDSKMREEVDELTQMLKGNLEKVVQHGKRADSIVKNMLLHSREGSGEHRPADINAIVEESLNLAYHGARAEKPAFNITLKRDLDPSAGMIDLYPQEITRVFLNLVSNGFYAATKRKEAGDAGFEPTLSATTRNLGNRVEIRIRDNGTGIPAEVKEKMFNPFFTTKPAGEGTGLGLSMSHDIIVKQHGGKIDVETTPGAFTEFIITLPRTAAQSQPGGTN